MDQNFILRERKTKEKINKRKQVTEGGNIWNPKNLKSWTLDQLDISNCLVWSESKLSLIFLDNLT